MQYVSLQMHESLQGWDQDIAHFPHESMRYEARYKPEYTAYMQRRWASVQDATKKDTESWKQGSVNGGIRTPV